LPYYLFYFLSIHIFLKKGMERVERIKARVGIMALMNGLGRLTTKRKITITT